MGNGSHACVVGWFFATDKRGKRNQQRKFTESLTGNLHLA